MYKVHYVPVWILFNTQYVYYKIQYYRDRKTRHYFHIPIVLSSQANATLGLYHRSNPL